MNRNQTGGTMNEWMDDMNVSLPHTRRHHDLVSLY